MPAADVWHIGIWDLESVWNLVLGIWDFKHPRTARKCYGLRLVQCHPELRERLRDNVAAVRTGLHRLGVAVDDWPTPIVAVQAGTAEQMQRLHAELRARGLIVPYIS
jgi:7-keto-8-aminopelargonate synthetase-like enzyme